MIIRFLKFSLPLNLVFVSYFALGQNKTSEFFSQTNVFFTEHIKNNGVDYASLKKSQKKIKDLIKLGNEVEFSNSDPDIEKAFWINIYNLLVIRSVIDHYPLFSVKDVPDFFEKKHFVIRGDTFSLNKIESNKLKIAYQDARLNFALCKGFSGSFPLKNSAYFPDGLNSQLNNQSSRVINDTNFIKLNADSSYQISGLFIENQDDFILSDGTVIAFVNKFRNLPLMENVQFNFFDPAEKLNDQTPIKSPGFYFQESDSNLRHNILPTAPSAKSEEDLTRFFIKANDFFNKYVNEGLVSYWEIKRHPGKLNELLDLVVSSDLKNAKPEVKKAFWINTYNILVLNSVLTYYPIRTISQIPDFFIREQFIIDGEWLSLDAIEEKKLKNVFKDPRINFTLCKAQLGSPPLLQEAYTPELLSSQVINAATAVINDSNFVNPEKTGTIRLSDLFLKNKSDFSISNGGLRGFINKFRVRAITLDSDSLFKFFESNPALNDDLSTFVSSKKTDDNSFKIESKYDDLNFEGNDDQVVGLNFISKKHFEIQFSNFLSSYRETYNKKLVRATSSFSYASNNSFLQLLYGIGRKTSVGLLVAGRTTRIDQTDNTVFEVYSFKKDTNSNVYFRNISPLMRFNVNEKYVQVIIQTTFNIPITHIKGLTYNGTRITDENPFLLNTQLFLFRNLSDYVKLGFEFYVPFQFNNKFEYFTFAMRAKLNTTFSVPLNKSIKLYGTLESGPTGAITGILDTYYFKDGAGIKYRFGKNEFTLYYGYVFLGKEIRAYNSLLLSIKCGL